MHSTGPHSEAVHEVLVLSGRRYSSLAFLGVEAAIDSASETCGSTETQDFPTSYIHYYTLLASSSIISSPSSVQMNMHVPVLYLLCVFSVQNMV